VLAEVGAAHQCNDQAVVGSTSMPLDVSSTYLSLSTGVGMCSSDNHPRAV